MITALCDRPLGSERCCRRLGSEDLGQCQPPHGQPADLQKMAPGVAIAIRRGLLAKDRKHGAVLSRASQRSRLRPGGSIQDWVEKSPGVSERASRTPIK